MTCGPGSCRIVMVSPAYNNDETAKTVTALADHADVLLLAPRLARTLVFRREPPRVRHPNLRVVGVPTVRLPGRQCLLLGYRQVLRRFRPCVVCVDYNPWSPVYLQIALLARWLPARPPLVALLKKNTYRRLPALRRRFKRMLGQFGLGRTAFVIAGSERARDLIGTHLGWPAELTEVQPHLGVDTALFSPAARRPDGAVRVGYVGRICRRKGVGDLIAALDLLDPPAHQMTLRLVGPVLDADYLRMVRGRSWIEHVTTRSNDRIPEVLRTLDIFVMPSRVEPDAEEHDARALLEAMACGLACVATDSGIMPEIARGGAVQIVPAGRPDLLAAAIAGMVSDRAGRAALGRAARQRAIEYADNAVVGRMRYETLNRVVERRRVPPPARVVPSRRRG